MPGLQCAFALQVNQVGIFPHSISCLHAAPSQCSSLSGQQIIPQTKVGKQTTGCSTTSELCYSSLLIPVHSQNFSTRFSASYKVTNLFPILSLDSILSTSTVVRRFTRIQGLSRCCVLLEEAQRKLSNSCTSRGHEEEVNNQSSFSLFFVLFKPVYFILTTSHCSKGLCLMLSCISMAVLTQELCSVYAESGCCMDFALPQNQGLSLSRVLTYGNSLLASGE